MIKSKVQSVDNLNLDQTRIIQSASRCYPGLFAQRSKAFNFSSFSKPVRHSPRKRHRIGHSTFQLSCFAPCLELFKTKPNFLASWLCRNLPPWIANTSETVVRIMKLFILYLRIFRKQMQDGIYINHAWVTAQEAWKLLLCVPNEAAAAGFRIN